MLKSLSYSLILVICSYLLAACPDTNTHYYPNTDWHAQHNLWSDIADHEKLYAQENQALVKKSIRWFLKRPSYLTELTENATPYLYYIFEATQKRHMPAEIALLPMIESNYNPFLYSKRGATGLWQLMPGTASGFGLTINWWYDGRRDVVASTNAALNYLAYLHHQFGDWMLAIAAYNAGEGTVQTAIAQNRKLGKSTHFWALSLPPETQTYLPKLLALSALLAHAKHYHIGLPHIPNKPYFQSIVLHRQIDLNHVAQYANTPLKNIRALNPGFRRWATLPHHTYALLIPEKQLAVFKQRLSHQAHTKPTIWQHHTISPGESLYVIARHYHTSVDLIARVNNLTNSDIRPKQQLLIPLAYHHLTLPNMHHTLSSVAEDKLPGPKRIMHIVAANDNLWTIAAQYHVKPDQIRYWNNLAYRENLKINQHLVIWQKHRQPHRYFYAYTIKPGDTLSGIARHFHIPVKTLKHLNHLPNDMLHAGKILTIPTHHQYS